jgi:CBS domain containing-hemolysin-like protein
MLTLLLYLFLALVVSFTCSIMEAVLLSVPQSFLHAEKERGAVWANSMIEQKSNVDRPLSAILSLNTVAHTIGAAGVGAQAVKIFGEAYFGLISAILTILILVITEIIPKTIGAKYWRGLAPFSTRMIRFMIFISYPLVLMSAYITRLFSSKEDGQTVSREEILALARIGALDGLFLDKEYRIIQNLLRLKNVKVTEIMTPRVVLATADESQPLSEFLKNKQYLKFSRIPVYSGDEENITGYVFRQTVLEKLAEDHHTMRLSMLRRDIVAVPYTQTLFHVWEKLLENREHIALIINEYGGVDGIVTMEDIIETLLGMEIVDEKDTITDMQQYAKERWKQRQAKYTFLTNDEKETGEKNDT